MLNFKYLKNGEVQSIIDNLKANKITNNCICLNNTDTILLRTNGSVIYGEYKDGSNRIRFTHSPEYSLPYIATKDYCKYKQIILDEWNKAYNDEAKNKMKEVRALINSLSNNKEYLDNNVTKNSKIINKEIKENKGDIKDMNKELNVMRLAHKIRKELGLEGHYSVQMKIAMKYAWDIKKGIKTIDNILEVSNIIKTNSNNNIIKEEIKENKIDNNISLTIYLERIENGIAYFYKQYKDKKACFHKYKVRNLIDMDKQFSKDLAKIINGLPCNSILYFYGDYTELAYLNNITLRNIAEEKNIKVLRGLYGVTPSGEAI